MRSGSPAGKELARCGSVRTFQPDSSRENNTAPLCGLGPHSPGRGYRSAVRQSTGECDHQSPSGRRDCAESQLGTLRPPFWIPGSPLQLRAYGTDKRPLSCSEQRLSYLLWQSCPSSYDSEREGRTVTLQDRGGELSRYLRCAGTCSCLPPASRCLSQDRKLQHSSSPRVRRVPRWHTAVH